ncbi:hypothetical protein CA850_07680 [Micromonospora echinospora]|uniref:Uncharacterized protein n=2 Tax=Micromonospora echinospora TaxID=1877 RepID=A0A1C4X5H3_MICEC|nr:hypothetical protein CA850_07680 [Micromonospora echinospora]SCF03692.1 hypothetical protein GA0070618_2771 [Micromonospora echinospora]
MDETGQPGAATPGEHGDGTGQQDDLAHSTSAWAPSGAGWSRAADDGFRGEPARTQWRPSDPGHGWASSSPQHGDLPAPMPGADEVSELPSRVNGRRLNGHALRDDAPGGRQVPVSAPPGPAGDPDHGRLAVPAQRPSPALEQTGEPGREAAALRHPTGGQPVLPSDDTAVRHPTGGYPVVEAGGATTRPAVDPGALRHPTGGHPTLSAEGRPARHASDGPPATHAEHPAEGSRPTSVPPAQSSAADPERRPWNTPTEPERPSWAGGGWAPPWSQEGGGGRRSRAERHREDDEPTGRRFREERPAEDVPPTWAPPSDAREPESRRLPDAVRAPSTDSTVPRSPSPEPLPGRTPRPEPAPDRTPAAEAGTPYRVAASGDARMPSGEAAPYRAAGRRSYEPEAEPRRPYPPVDQNTWAGRPTAAPSSAPPGPPPAEPAEPPGVRPETRTVRPFRLRPEAAEADHPPSAGRHPDRAGAGRLAAPATSAAGRVDPTLPAPAPASAPPYTARRSAPDPVSPAPSTVADRHPGGTPAVLPQRVPAEPDVPVVPEPPAVDPPAQTPEPARIATHLRREDESAPPQERPEGFDVDAILDAVRGVTGVRDASLRRTAAGAHSLRLDLSDGADAAEVSRMVARLLQERMGLAAAPQNVPGPVPAPDPPVRRRIAPPPPEGRAEVPTDVRRRRRQPGIPQGRASVEEQLSPWAAFGGGGAGSPMGATGSPATLGASYSGGQRTTTETAPSRPLDTGGAPGPRVVIDHVQVSTFGLDADVEVRLLAGARDASGRAVGPAVDGYVLRLCAVAAAAAVDELLRVAGSGRGRCFVEHAAVVPFGTCEVATVVVLLVCDGWVEQLAGSALVSGADPRQAVVRATLAAVNRRLEALLT